MRHLSSGSRFFDCRDFAHPRPPVISHVSGTIDLGEFTHLLRVIGAKVSSSDAAAIWDFIDANKSGHIEFEEFFLFYTAKLPQRRRSTFARTNSR